MAACVHSMVLSHIYSIRHTHTHTDTLHPRQTQYVGKRFFCLWNLMALTSLFCDSIAQTMECCLKTENGLLFYWWTINEIPTSFRHNGCVVCVRACVGASSFCMELFCCASVFVLWAIRANDMFFKIKKLYQRTNINLRAFVWKYCTQSFVLLIWMLIAECS